MALSQAREDADLPSDVAARVESELAHDELLVWIGQPIVARYARSAIGLVIFGVFWSAMVCVVFGGFFFVGLFRGAGPFANLVGLVTSCFAIPFVLAGIFLLTSPVWMRRLARKTCYAVTNRRAIIWEPGWFGRKQVRSYTAAGLGSMMRLERRDGTGDLIFEKFTTNNSEGPSTTSRGFKAISRVRDVENLIRNTLMSK